jgi:hypothetical protein
VRATILSGLGIKVSHLPPNTRYDATFEALSSEDDPAPYFFTMGGSSTDDRGRIFVVTDPADLLTYKNPLYEVRVWLRAPGTDADSPPALDADGNPIVTEISFAY